MPDCVWKRNRDGKLQCVDCGWIYPRAIGDDQSKWPHRNCPTKKALAIDLQPEASRLGLSVPELQSIKTSDIESVDKGVELAKSGAEKLGVSWADARHYLVALARWGKAGFPTRTDEEVRQYEAICRACEHYRDGRCAKCGCRVNLGPAVSNKIRMATENCPLDKWKRAEGGQLEKEQAEKPSSVPGYSQANSGLLTPNKRPILSGMQSSIYQNPLGQLLLPRMPAFSRRRCCLLKKEGACCHPDGSCTVTIERECAGIWKGLGTKCDSYSCSYCPICENWGESTPQDFLVSTSGSVPGFSGEHICHTGISESILYCDWTYIYNPTYPSCYTYGNLNKLTVWLNSYPSYNWWNIQFESAAYQLLIFQKLSAPNTCIPSGLFTKYSDLCSLNLSCTVTLL